MCPTASSWCLVAVWMAGHFLQDSMEQTPNEPIIQVFTSMTPALLASPDHCGALELLPPSGTRSPPGCGRSRVATLALHTFWGGFC